MRGKAVFPESGCSPSRITPAYAGKRMRHCAESNRRQDHPRLCGEKYIFGTRHRLAVGSPPPMRGKVCLFNLCKLHYRITPAYAGKSLDLKWKARKPQDHPRLCGEKPDTGIRPAAKSGSPPPMRGKEYLPEKYFRL